MINNEIKSCLVTIPLKEYLKLNNIFDNKVFSIGDTSFIKTNINIFVYNSNNECFKILGKYKHINYVLVEYNGLIQSISIPDLYITTYVVLKEQIKDLKYVEQLNLFPEDGKDKNPDIK